MNAVKAVSYSGDKSTFFVKLKPVYGKKSHNRTSDKLTRRDDAENGEFDVRLYMLEKAIRYRGYPKTLISPNREHIQESEILALPCHMKLKGPIIFLIFYVRKKILR